MGTTTFNGTVRSETGFSQITKNSTTGVITENTTIDSSGNTSVAGTLGVTGRSTLTGNTIATTAGTGITTGTGTVYAASVIKTGGIFHTKILIDLTGLASSGSGDIIGKAATANSHIGQITAAVNGTVLGGKLTCLEAPAGGDPDINLWYADEATGAEDAAITSLTNQTQMCDSGDLALNSVISIPTPPAADKYIYMVTGAATDADYTAGKLLIEFFGYTA
jgi:hypothetical protein|tara:strand:- start:758 stop:1420 length:663 start_codon:yes stop_codon:yes gene_type:complete